MGRRAAAPSRPGAGNTTGTAVRYASGRPARPQPL